MKSAKTLIVGVLALSFFGAAPLVQGHDSQPQDTRSRYETARHVLDKDFISPEDITKARGLSYSNQQLQYFVKTVPSNEILKWLKNNNYALMAGPPQPMGVLGVRSLKPELFYSTTDGWYANETFSIYDTVMPEWLAIKKKPVPNSINKNRNWNEQLGLLSKYERVPNAGEMSWFITTFYEVRGVRLFRRIFVRTLSVSSDGDRVGVGDFEEHKLGFSGWWGGSHSYSFGLAASRVFSEAR